MKIAHLILVHNQPNQLKRLIQKLSHPNDHFYIHLDKKADISPFLPLLGLPNVHLVKKRISVYWGSYSMVQATLNGMEEIKNTPIGFDWCNLLSGQDYPLASTEQIHNFLKKNNGKAFMEYYSVQEVWLEARTRLTQYYLTNYPFPGHYIIEKLMNALLPKRKMPENLIAVGKSQWFTIPMQQVEYILQYLDKHPSIKRFFSLTWGCDEIVFQTLLYNSPYQKDMVNNNLRYIDWSEGKASPKTLTIDDKESLLTSGKLFARKFNQDSQPQILDYLDKNTHNP